MRAFERAVGNGDREGVAYRALAKLYQTRQVNQPERAAAYYRLELTRLDVLGEQQQPTIEALMYLASHCTERGLFADAERYWCVAPRCAASSASEI